MENPERPRLALLDQHVRLLEKRLKELHGEAGAECAFVSDLNGTIVSRVGMTVGFDLETLALFVSKWFHAASEVGWYLGDSTAFDLSYHDGAWYDLYAANVGPHLFLSLIFAKTSQPSKIGMVWVLTRRAVRELMNLVATARVIEPGEPAVTEPAALPEEPRQTEQEPLPAELDELETSLWQAAEQSQDDAFSGLSFDEARRMGLIGPDLPGS